MATAVYIATFFVFVVVFQSFIVTFERIYCNFWAQLHIVSLILPLTFVNCSTNLPQETFFHSHWKVPSKYYFPSLFFVGKTRNWYEEVIPRVEQCCYCSVIYPDCRACWVLYISPFAWVSLCSMSLWWLSFCWVSWPCLNSGEEHDEQYHLKFTNWFQKIVYLPQISKLYKDHRYRKSPK